MCFEQNVLSPIPWRADRGGSRFTASEIFACISVLQLIDGQRRDLRRANGRIVSPPGTRRNRYRLGTVREEFLL